jgi:hypothetical protein
MERVQAGRGEPKANHRERGEDRQLVGKIVSLLERCVARRRQRYVHDQHAIHVRACVQVLEQQKRAHGQSRADEQDDREGDFGHHQEAAGRAAVTARARAPCGAEPVSDIGLRGLKRRREAEHDAGDQGDREREEQDGHIDRHARFVRDVELRHQPDDDPNRSEREEHSQYTTRERQQHAFSEELTHQTPASRAGLWNLAFRILNFELEL